MVSHMLRSLALCSALFFGGALASFAGEASAPDRTRLPIPDERPAAIQQADPKKAKMPVASAVGAPEKAPNILVVLLDDLGFGGPSTFGGPIPMPTLDRLAENGLRYNRFHTAALCAPTRVALRYGRNHHAANMGSIPEIATGFPGNTSRLRNDTASIAEILRLNGYNTAAFGKWHETPGSELTAAGPQDRWPTRQGFEKFYGFIGAEDNMFEPSLHDGVTLVDYPASPDYHLAEDMTDKAIAWVREQHSMAPDKPFFVYYAAPGVHAPHHVPVEWAEKYRGRFDEGWDKIRAATLQRQIEQGVVPPGTTLAETAETIPAWDSLSENEKRIYARQAEVFAAFAEYTDFEVGRLVDAIADLGELDDTLVIYISGDNGTSAEGLQTGNWNWGNMLNGRAETVEDQLPHLEHWGGPQTYPHMAVGWAIAFDAPFAFTKQVAGDFGGTRNGTVISWPAGIQAKGEVRSQFAYVTDVAPTILEAAGIPEPEYVDGVKQFPMQGESLVYSFDAADAPERHNEQYFEVVGNRGIYSDGWLARSIVKLPWETAKRGSVTDDSDWALFDTRSDFSLSKNVASENPERLERMKGKFVQQAIANWVYPLDDRLLERLLPEVAGRPTLLGDRTSITLYPGAIGINENALVNVKNRSSKVTARVSSDDVASESGVLFAQGGRFGGWALFVEDGVPGYVYNDLGNHTVLSAGEKLGKGEHVIEVAFKADSNAFGTGGELTLTVDGQKRASSRLERTVPSNYSIDEGADVGMDRGSPVLGRPLGQLRNSAYPGGLETITIEVEPQAS